MSPVVELDDRAVDRLLERHAAEVVVGDLNRDVGPHLVKGAETVGRIGATYLCCGN